MLTRTELQTLYDQGLDAVFALLQTLGATLRAQQGQLDALQEQNTRLVEQNVGLHERIHELEARLNKNSNNSSKPPASDGFQKKAPPVNLRQKTGKPSGGQPGHGGHTLKWRDDPDQTISHAPHACSACGTSLLEVPGVLAEKRQVFDLPPLTLQVSEHQSVAWVCPHCQTRTVGAFPPKVTQPTQYGPEILALGVYLNQYQLLPLARTHEMLADLLGYAPSQRALLTAIGEAYHALAPVEAIIKTAVATANVSHFDETGVRAACHLHWIHVACTPTLTVYAHSLYRGRKAFAEIGILPRFQGTSVPDGYTAYQDPRYPGRHALCNAHHLRELLGLFETTRQTWSQRMSTLLRRLKRRKEAAQTRNELALDLGQLARYRQAYRLILTKGLRQNPLPAPTGQRGRPAQGVARSLLLRLQASEEAVLRFATDFAVPFDNNQAERDLRMIKVQQKVSGCFRTVEGAEHFCRIRGYISTMRKQRTSLLTALRSVFIGQLIYPCLTPA